MRHPADSVLAVQSERGQRESRHLSATTSRSFALALVVSAPRGSRPGVFALCQQKMRRA